MLGVMGLEATRREHSQSGHPPMGFPHCCQHGTTGNPTAKRLLTAEKPYPGDI